MVQSRVGICCIVFVVLGLLSPGCRQKLIDQPDQPRLGPNVVLRDVMFHSASLNRDMRYRAILPAVTSPGARLPAVYLLHGGGGTFRDWSNYSDVGRIAQGEFILIMPQGDYSYYVNAVGRPADRYEEYIVRDLIADAESRFPIAPEREFRAIVGVSMGGFGAITIALKHPERFIFVGALSPAVDVVRRSFSVRRIQQSRAFETLFGPWNSDARRALDPFNLAKAVSSAESPYLFLTCGDQEGLLPPNRDFAALLARQHLAHEFHVASGSHDWNQWNEEIPALLSQIRRHMGLLGKQPPA